MALNPLTCAQTCAETRPQFDRRTGGRRGAAILAAALAVLAGLPACGGEDRPHDKIVKARATLSSLGASGTAAPSAARSRAYDQILADMQGIASGGGPSVAGAAAKLISAQAMLGQGEILASAQRADETSVTRLAEAARVKLELFVKLESLAASLEGHDQSRSVEMLSAEIGRLGALLEAAKTREGETAAALAKIKVTAAELGAGARIKRDEAGQLRATMQQASGEARLAIAEEAAKRRREADLLEVDQAKIELGVGELERQRDETALEVARIERQIELARASVRRAEESARLLKEQSAEARSKAAEVGAEVGAALEALGAEIEQKLKVSYEAAKSKYESASSTASGGSASDGALSKALSGAAQQALAGLHAGFAGAMENAADAAGRIGAQKGLSSAPKAREWSGAWMEEVKAARDASASAAAQAGANFQAANPKGAGADILRKLGEKLTPPEPAQPENPVDAAPPGEQAPEAEAGAEAPAEAPAQETPAASPAEQPAETPEPK